MRGAPFAALGLGLGLVSVPLPGQVTDRKPASFGASVSIVAVPVFVLDKSGRAVPDLRLEDFEVLDRGRPQPIVAFESINALAPLPAAGSDPPASPTLQASSRRQFLFLFDVSFARPRQLFRARQAAAQMVQEKLGPRDLVAVATSSTQHGVKVLVGFTSDRQQVVQAIKTLGLTQKPDPSDPLGLTFAPSPGPRVPADWNADDSDEPGDETEGADAMPSPAPELHEFQAQRFLDNLKQIARAVGAVQGRKQLVLFSPGFKERTLVGKRSEAGTFAEFGASRLPRSDDAFGSAGIRRSLDEALKAFAASDVVVHAVDVSGLQAPTDVGRRGEALPLRQGQESLVQIAHRSGGRLVKETNNLALGLGEVLDTSRHFYVLAFVAEPSGKLGRHHEITVRVRRQGLHVLHRQGYLETAPSTLPPRLLSRGEVAEFLAKGLSGGEVRVDALAVPYRDAQGRVSLPVIFEIDAAALLEGEPRSEGAVEVYAYAFDDQGRVADLAAVTSSPKLAELRARVREGGLYAATVLDVKPGPHEVRYLVREVATGRFGAGRLRVDVPAFAAGETVLHPPLFMDSRGDGLVLTLPSRAHPHPDLPFRVDEEVFRPWARPRLANGRPQAVCVMFTTGGTEYAPGSSFEVQARLVNAQGAARSPGKVVLLKAVAETDGFRRFKLEVTPQDVPPGEYAFQVDVRDPASGGYTRSQRPISVD